MKIRTMYLKVDSVADAAKFWSSVLGIRPHKNSASWAEFMVGGLRFALLTKPRDDQFRGSSCVPVFEFNDDELTLYIERAKSLGASVVIDGLEDPDIRGIVFSDPFGHEFEFTKFHGD